MLNLGPRDNRPTCKRRLQITTSVHRVVKEYLTTASVDQHLKQAGGRL